MVGSMVAKVRQDREAGVPNYIVGADPGRDQIDVFSFGSAYLGPSTHPFSVAGDPSSPKFEVKNLSVPPQVERRLDDRLDLLRGFDKVPAAIDATGAMAAMDSYKGKALKLVKSDAGKAFDLSQEPAPAARALRHARLGPAGAAGPPAGRARGQLCHDGHGEPLPVWRAVPQGRHL